ncbi:hypothetical protein [Burkholderia sp. F1]|uniref:hypothetical protein n=1 Tax=Burkholderia sp. F1 TaxID=3366817 RepID=UPI003D7468B9
MTAMAPRLGAESNPARLQPPGCTRRHPHRVVVGASRQKSRPLVGQLGIDILLIRASDEILPSGSVLLVQRIPCCRENSNKPSCPVVVKTTLASLPKSSIRSAIEFVIACPIEITPEVWTFTRIPKADADH